MGTYRQHERSTFQAGRIGTNAAIPWGEVLARETQCLGDYTKAEPGSVRF
jgi:hypothetical protein